MSLPVINFLELNSKLKTEIYVQATTNPESMDRFLIIYTNEGYPVSEVLKRLSEAEFPLNEYLKELRVKNAKEAVYIYRNPFTKQEYKLNYGILNELINKIQNLLI